LGGGRMCFFPCVCVCWGGGVGGGGGGGVELRV